VKAGVLEGNPVHEECESVAAMIEPTFGVNVAVDELGRAVQVVAGHWREAHRAACRAYLKRIHWNSSQTQDCYRRLLRIAIGHQSYPSAQSLDMAALACEDGGTIILLAECREGFGRQDFLKWFCLGDSAALETRLRDSYEVNGQTAWALLTKAERFKVILVSELEPDDVRQMRMVPARSLKDAMSEVDPNADGFHHAARRCITARTAELTSNRLPAAKHPTRIQTSSSTLNRRTAVKIRLLTIVAAVLSLSVISVSAQQDAAEARVPLSGTAVALDSNHAAALEGTLRTTALNGAPDMPVTNIRLVLKNVSAIPYSYVSGLVTFYDGAGVRCGEGLVKADVLAVNESVETDTPGIRIRCSPANWRIVATNLIPRISPGPTMLPYGKQ
jgi:hypothetical protein